MASSPKIELAKNQPTVVGRVTSVGAISGTATLKLRIGHSHSSDSQ